jgi:parallel beta-helix repeat protein
MKNKLFSMKFLLLLFSFALILNGSITQAAQIGEPAGVIYVSQFRFAATDTEDCGTTRRQSCRTIQHAVHRIAPGGFIRVFPGTYTENILVDKPNVTIASFGGSSRTIIDGSHASNEVVSEAMRIIADGVTIGRKKSSRSGFTFRNSAASGLFNVGSNVTISGNVAKNNGARGFQFGLSTIDDSIDTSSKNIPDDPLNGATFFDNAQLQTQSNVTVDRNVAKGNALGGFYFSAFDDSVVRHSRAAFNRSSGSLNPRSGRGSGFWIDSGSNVVTLDSNRASNNEGDGIFYRRGFGEQPAGMVTDQTAIFNVVTSNGRHGIILMGNNIIAQDNIAKSNQSDGIHLVGYDTVLDVSYNAVIGNSGAGIGFNDDTIGQFVFNPFVSPIIFDAHGEPIEFGGVHHNIIINNLSHSLPDLGGDFDNCAVASILDNGTRIELSHNFLHDQNICDLTDNTIVRFEAAQNPSGLGPRTNRRRLHKAE